MLIFEREREHEWGRDKERGRPRIQSRLQALSCQHRTQHGDRIHKLRGHDLSQSRMLNGWSHPGAPVPGAFYQRAALSIAGSALGGKREEQLHALAGEPALVPGPLTRHLPPVSPGQWWTLSHTTSPDTPKWAESI